jgi:hypothetical protein
LKASSAILYWLAAVGSIASALALEYIAHSEFGVSLPDIRDAAILGSSIVGVLLATEYFGGKLRKPK